ncbi:MAG: hypothetical protein Ct9H300mP20_05920 [Gammaproteobacteria bacterium]|nr:MAG: hypothetical protein Ct9H300mP20_05920 [Gammaproteobacteria bacterium]
MCCALLIMVAFLFWLKLVMERGHYLQSTAPLKKDALTIFWGAVHYVLEAWVLTFNDLSWVALFLYFYLLSGLLAGLAGCLIGPFLNKTIELSFYLLGQDLQIGLFINLAKI